MVATVTVLYPIYDLGAARFYRPGPWPRILSHDEPRPSTTEPTMSEPTPRDQIARTITGYWTSQAVYVAAKLRIADCLADGPKTAEALAEATGTHPRTLHRLLRALASVGVFSEEDAGRFRLTPAAE